MVLFILVEGLALMAAGAFILHRFGARPLPGAVAPGPAAAPPDSADQADRAGWHLVLAGLAVQLAAVALAAFG
jgi:hypothetical protein